MSKQEEFGSEITKLIIIGNRDCIGSENIAQNILTYLKSQGIVVEKNVSLNDHIAEYVKADNQFIEGIRKGVQACKEGRVRKWTDIKRELGLGLLVSLRKRRRKGIGLDK